MMDAKDKPPTIKDVARVAGVGLGTVSRYLNASDAISEPTRARVAAAIETLGYQVNRNAAALRGRESRIIGLLLPDLDNAAFPPIVKAIERAARADGYSLIVTACDRDFAIEAEAISVLVARQVSGLIMIPTTDSNSALAAAIGNNAMPIVLLDRDLLTERQGTSRLYIRHDSGMRDATRYLIERGHRQLLLLHAGDNRAARSRQAGFREALDEAATDHPGIDGVMIACARSGAASRAAVDEVFSSGPIPDAIIVGHNRMLSGVLGALTDRGIRVGKDISVITSDRTELAELYTPPIAWIDRNFEAIGATAYRFFRELAAGPGQGCDDEISTQFHPTASIGRF